LPQHYFLELIATGIMMSTMAETKHTSRAGYGGQAAGNGTKQEFHLKNNEFSCKGACKTTLSSS